MNTVTDVNIPAIIELAKENGRLLVQKPEITTIAGTSCLVAPTGVITPLVLPEKFLANPKRKRAAVTLVEAHSFIEYVNRHQLAGRTHLFGQATTGGGSFTAILDYHNVERNPAPNTAVTLGKPEDPAALAQWGEHTATFQLSTTPEWQRWIANNGKLLPQSEFAEFIEANLGDIKAPAAGEILDFAQGLQGKKSVSFKNGRNLRNGSIQFEYTEQVEVNGTANAKSDKYLAPEKMTLQLIPFVGVAVGVELEARLRFRVGGDGALFFAYLLTRPEKVVEDAFKATREEIEGATSLPVLLGKGEIKSG